MTKDKTPRQLHEIVKGMILHRDDLLRDAKSMKATAYGMAPSTSRWKLEMDARLCSVQAEQLDIFIPDLQELIKEA